MHAKNRILKVKQSTSYSKRSIAKYFSSGRCKDTHTIKKKVIKSNQENLITKNKGKHGKPRLNLASGLENMANSDNRFKMISRTRNLFSSMDMYFSDIRNKEIKSQNELVPRTRAPSMCGESPVKLQSFSPTNPFGLYTPLSKRKSTLTSEARRKRKQQTIDVYLSPKKKQKFPDENSSTSRKNLAVACRSTSSDSISKNAIIDLTNDSDDTESKGLLLKTSTVKETTLESNNQTSACHTLDSSKKSLITFLQTAKDEPSFSGQSSKSVAVDHEINDMYKLFTDRQSVSEKSPDVDSSCDELEIPVFSVKSHSSRYSSASDENTKLNLSRDDEYDKLKVASSSNSCQLTPLKTSASPSFRQNTSAVPKNSPMKKIEVEKQVTFYFESENSTRKKASLTDTRKLLDGLLNECAPITPRKVKRDHNRSPSSSLVSENEEETVKPEPKLQKLTYTLSKILKEKQKNEEFKNIEVKLLEDLKKGGFGRFVNSSDSENEADNFSEDPVYGNLSRVLFSTEDCLGIQETKQKIGLFSRKRMFSYFCCHTVICDERIYSLFPSKMDVQSRLNFLLNHISVLLGTDEEASQNSCFLKEKIECLVSWLIQILSCYSDPVVLRMAQRCLTSLASNSKVKIETRTTFHQAFCNLGIKKKFLHQDCDFKRNSCKKCAGGKKSYSCPARNIDQLIQAYLTVISKNALVNDVELYRLLSTALLLLATQEDKSGLSLPPLYHFIDTTLNKANDVTLLLQKTTNYLLHHIDDVNTLHYLVTMLPSRCKRTTSLRRCIAYSVLARLFGEDEKERDRQISDGVSLDRILRFASSLSVSLVRSSIKLLDANASNRDVHVALWTCVSLVQICNETFRGERTYRDNLETLTESMRNLNMSIRDNGFLYCSEVKYFIRLATALAEFQLQKMPKSQLYQQGIFKYLREASVDEEVVEVAPCDDTDSAEQSAPEDELANSDLAASSSSDPGSSGRQSSLLTSSSCYVPLVDCESLLRRHQIGSDRTSPTSRSAIERNKDSDVEIDSLFKCGFNVARFSPETHQSREKLSDVTFETDPIYDSKTNVSSFAVSGVCFKTESILKPRAQSPVVENPNLTRQEPPVTGSTCDSNQPEVSSTCKRNDCLNADADAKLNATDSSAFLGNIDLVSKDQQPDLQFSTREDYFESVSQSPAYSSSSETRFHSTGELPLVGDANNSRTEAKLKSDFPTGANLNSNNNMDQPSATTSKNEHLSSVNSLRQKEFFCKALQPEANSTAPSTLQSICLSMFHAISQSPNDVLAT